MFFINDVAAQTVGGGSSIMSIIPFVAIFVLMYFVVIRPQSKKAKEQKTMQEGLSVGKFVVTSSGVIGRIAKLDDQEVHLEISRGQVIRLLKSYVAGVLENQKQVLVGRSEEDSSSSRTNVRRPAVSKTAAKRVAEKKTVSEEK